jgi:hypothetical protein
MPPIKEKGGRPEYEVAYYTKELGRTLQRKLLKQRLAEFSDSQSAEAAHGEDAAPETNALPPQEDRAG